MRLKCIGMGRPHRTTEERLQQGDGENGRSKSSKGE